MFYRICTLTTKFNTKANKIQTKINKVQFSRPRGNPGNQWPHVPMTNSIRIFYNNKEIKERKLRQNKDLLQQTFHLDKALLTSQWLTLENVQMDIESEIKIIKIKLHQWIYVLLFGVVC